MNTYLLKILTPEKRMYDGQVVSVTVTSAAGRLTVLAGHMPMVALLTEGPIIIRTNQDTIEGVAGHGILRVDRKETAVMVHTFKGADAKAELQSAENETEKDVLL